MSKTKLYAIVAAGAVVLLTAAGIGYRQSKMKNKEMMGEPYEVHRGSLTISVSESGTIKARDQVIIKNEVEGRTSIIYLIPEGTRVKQGDLLVKLDSSTLEDSKIEQEIKVQNAEASYISSKENLEVTKNQAQSDVDLAELKFEFAKQDLKKYLDGEYPNLLQKSDAEITLAEEDLTRARETLKWSEKLYEEKYISQTELQADQLSEKKKDLDLKLARNNKELLTKFTYQRQQAQLESDVKQAEMALQRAQSKARANVAQSEAELRAKEAEYLRQKDKLDKNADQIQKTQIYAPTDGLVIYATSARTGGFRGAVEPLEEGQDVRERQELIYLPTANSSKAEVAIHESNLQKIRVGLPALIKVDSLPGEVFWGEVAHIAPLPDAQSMWMNPDLKVFTTEINIDDNGGDLRTGMSCQAEIIIATYEDAIYVPVQAVLRVNGEPTVYVRHGNQWQPRVVKVGLDNNVMIHVSEGLQEGETVLLTPSLKAGEDTQDKLAVKPPGGANGASREKAEQKNKEAAARAKAALEKSGKGVKTNGPSPGQDGNPSGAGENRRDVGEPGKGDNQVGQGERRRRRPENMTPEQQQQMQQMRKRFESMTDEEREQMRKRFENMSPEEKQKLMKQFGQSQAEDSDKAGAKPESGENPPPGDGPRPEPGKEGPPPDKAGPPPGGGSPPAGGGAGGPPPG